MNKTDMIIDFGKTITEGCIEYYDLVNDTENYNICVGMSAEVKNNSTGQKYRYTIKIEKEEIEND